MKKNGETLADALIREWSTKTYRKKIDLHGWIPRHVALARKFYLDDEMSAFMADLAYASMPRIRDQKKVVSWLDSLRVMSRLPHDLTWIEFDMKKRAARSAAEYNAELADYKGPQKSGWLLRKRRSEDIEIFSNATEEEMSRLPPIAQGQEWFEAIPCSSQSMSDSDWATAELLDIPNAGPLGYLWTSGEVGFPNTEWLIKTRHVISRALTGIDYYRSDCVSLMRPEYVTSNPRMNNYVSSMDVSKYLQEQAGDLRYLWAFLATINDLPVLKTHVKPDKGHMVRGNYRRFSEHTIISLKVPARVSLSAVARRALRASRRRAHQVRGHWRVDWRAAPAALCEHVWVGGEDEATCRLCRGRKTWVHEHQRGDASLGFVLHDYAVQRGETR